MAKYVFATHVITNCMRLFMEKKEKISSTQWRYRMKTELTCVCFSYNFHYDQFHTCQSYGTIVLRQASVSLHLLVNEYVKVFAKGTKSRRKREREREWVESRIDGKHTERNVAIAIWKFYLWCSFCTLWAFRMNEWNKAPQKRVCVYDNRKRERSLLLRSFYHNDEIIYTHTRISSLGTHNTIQYSTMR